MKTNKNTKELKSCVTIVSLGFIHSGLDLIDKVVFAIANFDVADSDITFGEADDKLYLALSRVWALPDHQNISLEGLKAFDETVCKLSAVLAHMSTKEKSKLPVLSREDIFELIDIGDSLVDEEVEPKIGNIFADGMVDYIKSKQGSDAKMADMKGQTTKAKAKKAKAKKAKAKKSTDTHIHLGDAILDTAKYTIAGVAIGTMGWFGWKYGPALYREYFETDEADTSVVVSALFSGISSW